MTSQSPSENEDDGCAPLWRSLSARFCDFCKSAKIGALSATESTVAVDRYRRRDCGNLRAWGTHCRQSVRSWDVRSARRDIDVDRRGDVVSKLWQRWTYIFAWCVECRMTYGWREDDNASAHT